MDQNWSLATYEGIFTRFPEYSPQYFGMGIAVSEGKE